MIVQRKVDIDGEQGYIGEYWEDIKIPVPTPDRILKWLATLPDAVGTEYRISDLVSTAIMSKRSDICYVDWKTGHQL